MTGCPKTAGCASASAGPAAPTISTTAIARCRSIASRPVLGAGPRVSLACKRSVSDGHRRSCEAHGVLQVGQEFDDFADTAAVVGLLDLVISVDTSVAHLAGAMGKATGLLVPFSPDWRWLLRPYRQSLVSDHAFVPPKCDRRLGCAACADQERAGRRRRPGAVTSYSTRLTASGCPCFGLGAVVRPEAP